MEHKIYSVYDSVVEAYLQPFCAQTKGHAVRMFSDTVNDPNSVFAKHPDDYVLFELGSWSDSDAKYTMHPAPVSLGVALEFKVGSNE